MIKTWAEEARDQGQEIVLKQWRKMVPIKLNQRFGPLSESVQKKLEVLSMDELEASTENLMTAQSLRELGLEDDANCAKK